MDARFKIGTTFRTRGKHPHDCVVRDILRTYNSTGKLVKLRYLATHQLMGQAVEEEVCETEIARGEPQEAMS